MFAYVAEKYDISNGPQLRSMAWNPDEVKIHGLPTNATNHISISIHYTMRYNLTLKSFLSISI